PLPRAVPEQRRVLAAAGFAGLGEARRKAADSTRCLGATGPYWVILRASTLRRRSVVPHAGKRRHEQGAQRSIGSARNGRPKTLASRLARHNRRRDRGLLADADRRRRDAGLRNAADRGR